MATFLVCHGAWSGGWSWKKMRGPLAARGHDAADADLYRARRAQPIWPIRDRAGDPYRRHHGRARIRGSAAIVILVGHSYGGMVATAVADRAPERVKHVSSISTPSCPQDGEMRPRSASRPQAERMRAVGQRQGDGWRLPPRPLAPDIAPEDVDWLTPRRSWMPFKTFSQRIRLTGGGAGISGAFIHCTHKVGRRSVPGDGRTRPRPAGLAYLRARRRPYAQHHDAGAAGRTLRPHRRRGAAQ